MGKTRAGYKTRERAKIGKFNQTPPTVLDADPRLESRNLSN